MSEKKAIFIIDILKNIIEVYFDTFFVFYFFKVANYEIIPLVKYFLTMYFFTGIGFILIKNAMKKNIKVSYFRIGIALQAVYIALIMLLKDNIINYIIIVAFVRGLAEGFYHYPKNILNTEKIQNEGRQKYDGLVNIVNKIIAIIVPLILGVALTHFSYTNVGKVFFVCFIIMFIISFSLKDHNFNNNKIDIKGFKNIIKSNKCVRLATLTRIFAGLTYSGGVMELIITLSKINNFKTNLNLGFVDSICAGLSLIVFIFFTVQLKENNFKKALIVSGLFSCAAMLFFGVFPNYLSLVIYLIVRFSMVILIEKIVGVVTTNISNEDKLLSNYKAEYYLIRDVFYAFARCTGFILLFLICEIIGVKYINYLMIICAIAILLEAFCIASLCNGKKESKNARN